MLACFLHMSKVDNYENHRSKLHKETTGVVGVHRAAETKPDNIV